MKVGVAKETYPGERRVALLPLNVAQLNKAGVQIVIEKGAGESAGISDQDYVDKGAHLGSISNGTTICIDKIKDSYVFANLNIDEMLAITIHI